MVLGYGYWSHLQRVILEEKLILAYSFLLCSINLVFGVVPFIYFFYRSYVDFVSLLKTSWEWYWVVDFVLRCHAGNNSCDKLIISLHVHSGLVLDSVTFYI